MFFIAAAVAAVAITGASAQEVANAAPTPAPGYDYAYTQEMPYTWMTSEGYKSVDCGYGYGKDESQHCKKADWVRPIHSAHPARLPLTTYIPHFHFLALANSMISRAAMQQRLSSKLPLLLISPPRPSQPPFG